MPPSPSETGVDYATVKCFLKHVSYEYQAQREHIFEENLTGVQLLRMCGRALSVPLHENTNTLRARAQRTCLCAAFVSLMIGVKFFHAKHAEVYPIKKYDPFTSCLPEIEIMF